jgi:hypothetical protein
MGLLYLYIAFFLLILQIDPFTPIPSNYANDNHTSDKMLKFLDTAPLLKLRRGRKIILWGPIPLSAAPPTRNAH